MSLANALLSCGATVQALVLPPIGSPLQGGFYYGKIKIGAITYALVVSPRASGEVNGPPMQDDTEYTFMGNVSTNDGKTIQANMVAHGIAKFPTQQAVMALNIGGYTDWYIPSKDEMEIMYRALKPTTTPNNTSSGINASAVPPTTTNYTPSVPARTTLADFRTSGANYLTADYYYTATQGSSGPTFAHAKRFTSGIDSQDQIWFDYPVRAIRRIAL